MFQLLRYFSIASAIVTMFVTVGIISFHYSSEQDNLYNASQKHNEAMARSFANTFWNHYSEYLSSLEHNDGNTLRANPETQALDREFRKITEGLPILKVKIHSPNGLTLYSSDPRQIGERKDGSVEFQSAVRTGVPHSKISFKTGFAAFSGDVANVHIAESYVPITDAAGKVLSVFELYTDISLGVAANRVEIIELTLALVSAFATLYVVLFLVVRRAARILNLQNSQLLSFNSILEYQVEVRTSAAREMTVAAQQHQRDLLIQNTRFNAALCNMGDGLCMFDGALTRVSQHR